MVATLPRPIIPNQDLNAIIAGLNPIQMVCIPFTLPLAVCLVMAVLSPKSLSDDFSGWPAPQPFLSIKRRDVARVCWPKSSIFSIGDIANLLFASREMVTRSYR